MTKLNCPAHKHPHGVESKPENPERIWVCDECHSVFFDDEARADLSDVWGHKCKSHPNNKVCRCESHLEPYLFDMG